MTNFPVKKPTKRANLLTRAKSILDELRSKPTAGTDVPVVKLSIGSKLRLVLEKEMRARCMSYRVTVRVGKNAGEALWWIA